MEKEHLCPALAHNVQMGNVREHFFLKARHRSQAGISRGALGEDAATPVFAEAVALATLGTVPPDGSPGAAAIGLGSIDGVGGGRDVVPTTAEAAPEDETSGVISGAPPAGAGDVCGGGRDARGSTGGEAERRRVDGDDGDVRRTRKRWMLDLICSGDIATGLPVKTARRRRNARLESEGGRSVGRSLCAGASQAHR